MFNLAALKELSMTVTGAILLTLIKGKPLQAAQIGLGDFGKTSVIESFEDLSPGLNMSFNGGGYLGPAVNEPFTFASGVALTSPAPNSSIYEGTVIGDWSRGFSYFGLMGNGAIESAEDVPDGSAYLGFNNPASSGSIEFTFASNVLRAGALVTSESSGFSGNGVISLLAFDSSNNFLDKVSISSVSVSDWRTNFLGLEHSSGIRKIVFKGNFTVLDKLTFEAIPSSESIPEPATFLGLLVVTVFAASSTRRP